jgi:hypothetical protein
MPAMPSALDPILPLNGPAAARQINRRQGVQREPKRVNLDLVPGWPAAAPALFMDNPNPIEA